MFDFDLSRAFETLPNVSFLTVDEVFSNRVFTLVTIKYATLCKDIERPCIYLLQLRSHVKSINKQGVASIGRLT